MSVLASGNEPKEDFINNKDRCFKIINNDFKEVNTYPIITSKLRIIINK